MSFRKNLKKLVSILLITVYYYVFFNSKFDYRLVQEMGIEELLKNRLQWQGKKKMEICG